MSGEGISYFEFRSCCYKQYMMSAINIRSSRTCMSWCIKHSFTNYFSTACLTLALCKQLPCHGKCIIKELTSFGSTRHDLVIGGNISLFVHFTSSILLKCIPKGAHIRVSLPVQVSTIAVPFNLFIIICVVCIRFHAIHCVQWFVQVFRRLIIALHKDSCWNCGKLYIFSSLLTDDAIIVVCFLLLDISIFGTPYLRWPSANFGQSDHCSLLLSQPLRYWHVALYSICNANSALR